MEDVARRKQPEQTDEEEETLLSKGQTLNGVPVSDNMVLDLNSV